MTSKGLRSVMAAGLLVTVSALLSNAISAQTKVKPGFNVFSADQDLEIGRQSALEVESQLPILRDSAVEAYVGAVGKRLAATIPGPKFPYQFKIVNASDINAFALPGGYMYLNRGLIEAAQNEGQLAGVMAHEMSHVALRHGTNQASTAYLGQAGLGLLGGLLKKDDGSPNRVIDAVGGFGLNALFLKFSRKDEEQADIVGAQTMARAGYNPQDMVDFFELLRSQQARNPSKVEQFFSSHPAPANRAERIRNEMRMLTVTSTQPVGGLSKAQARLTAMPAARSMEQLAQNQPAPQPRAATDGRFGEVTIAAPSSTFRTFEQRNRFFRIQYPSNWTAHESMQDLGVTFAPEGGLVDAGGREQDLIAGVIVNHYEPFLSDVEEGNERFALPFQSSPGGSGNGNTSRTFLAEATNDLVAEILRTNPTLRLVPDSQRTDTIDGAPALSLVLSGRSAVTGQEERVTVFTRALADDHVVYSLFIAPGSQYAELRETFNRMIDSLEINDAHTSTTGQFDLGSYDVDGSVPVKSQGSYVTAPPGTTVQMTLSTPVGSATSREGDLVTATTAAAVVVDNRVAIPAGSTIRGRVTAVESASKGLSKKGGTVYLAFNEVTTPDGHRTPISGSLSSSAGSKKSTAVAIGGGAAAGAILGKILGGDTKDAVIGAIVGGGIGTGIAAGKKGKEVEIPAGTALEMTLDQSVTIAQGR